MAVAVEMVTLGVGRMVAREVVTMVAVMEEMVKMIRTIIVDRAQERI